MNIHMLPKITRRPAKRVGRGIGSGKGGHTTGRGNKGQKGRETVAIQMEGTKWKKSLVKRMPFLRGKNKMKAWGEKAVVVRLGDLAEWPTKTEVNLDSLIKAGMVGPETKKVKILADGQAPKGLKIGVPISAAAAKKIEASDGTINGK